MWLLHTSKQMTCWLEDSKGEGKHYSVRQAVLKMEFPTIHLQNCGEMLFYTIWHGRASHTHLEWRSAHRFPAAKTHSTHFAKYLTVWRLHCSNRITRRLQDKNCKGIQKSPRQAAIRTGLPNISSPNLWNTLQAIPTQLAIPMIPVPITPNRTSAISPVGGAIPTHRQHHGFRRMFKNDERQTGNGFTVVEVSPKLTIVPTTSNWSQLNSTTAMITAITAIILSTKCHSTRSSKKTCLPWSISNLMGEAEWHRVRIWNIGDQVVFATLDKIQTDKIAIKWRVILEGRALKTSMCLCGTKRPIRRTFLTKFSNHTYTVQCSMT